MKRVLQNSFIALFLLSYLSVKAQPTAYDASAVDSLLLKGNKDVLVFMYTDWCRYCTAMKQTTFKNRGVVQMLNQHFYFVPFNAENKNSVTINGKQYRYAPTGVGTGVHELAAALSGQSTPAFPFIAIINKKGTLVFTDNSYLSAKELMAVLNHVLEQRELQ